MDGMVEMHVDVRRTATGYEIWVEYDGSEPPLSVFASWAEMGWVPPTPTPPPREAIDWSTPDPHGGRRYSIRSYRAEGVAVPRPGARMGEPQVDAALAVLRDSIPRVASSLDGPRPTDAPMVRISTSQPVHAASDVESRARALGAAVERRQRTIERQVIYRGSTNTVSSPVIDMSIDVARSEMRAVLDVASQHALAPATVVDLTDET
jgi:hypothetical protein